MASQAYAQRFHDRPLSDASSWLANDRVMEAKKRRYMEFAREIELVHQEVAITGDLIKVIFVGPDKLGVTIELLERVAVPR